MTRRGQDTQLPLLGVGAPVRLIHGDSLAVLPLLAADSVDAIVTDPPYGLAFMGKAFDTLGDGPSQQAWHQQWAVEALRVAKPGAHLLAFGGSRTYHRMACALEDAGWEIRDCLLFLYGGGFPKGQDISKAIDRAAGATRAVVGSKLGQPGCSLADHGSNRQVLGDLHDHVTECAITAPATPEAAAWAGWNTQLKPAYEPILLCRKPLAAGTVARNVLAHGTGALNIDACRVPGTKDVPASMPRDRTGHGILGAFGTHAGGDGQDPTVGRWPANVVHDGSAEVEAAFAIYGQKGASAPVKGTEASPACHGQVTGQRARVPGVFHADAGSAARFFYTAKASKKERFALLSCGCENPRLESWQKQDQSQADPMECTSPEKDTCAEDTMDAFNCSMSSCGPKQMDLFRQGLASITSMEISRTTESKTYQSLRQQNISDCTQGVNSETACGGSLVDPAECHSQSQINISTFQKRDGRYMGVVVNATSPLLLGRSVCEKCGQEVVRTQHPTQKPEALMRWLVKLVTRPGGTVLDPFMGSGSTGRACQAEGFGFIGIEREAAYAAIAQRRLLAKDLEVLP